MYIFNLITIYYLSSLPLSCGAHSLYGISLALIKYAVQKPARLIILFLMVF